MAQGDIADHLPAMDGNAAAHRQSGADCRNHHGDLAQTGHCGHRVGADVGCHQGIQNFEELSQHLIQRQRRANLQQEL